MSSAFVIVENLVYQSETCCSCGVPFAMEQSYWQERKNKGGRFFCPNGHGQVYRETAIMRAEAAAKRAQELLEQERRRTEQLRLDVAHMDKRRQAEMASKTRIKNRVARGVCFCCNRTFENLARHMATKHPKEINQHKEPERG